MGHCVYGGGIFCLHSFKHIGFLIHTHAQPSVTLQLLQCPQDDINSPRMSMWFKVTLNNLKGNFGELQLPTVQILHTFTDNKLIHSETNNLSEANGSHCAPNLEVPGLPCSSSQSTGRLSVA